MELTQKSIGKAWNKILDAIFPPKCVNCQCSINNQKEFLCPQCFDLIKLNSSLYCPVCMSRLGERSNTCHRSPYILAPSTFFMPPIPALIHHFKYSLLEDINTLLSAFLIAYLKKIDIPLEKYEITFIPLHRSKERSRGFNQSRLLANSIASYFSIQTKDCFVRIQNTPSQTTQEGFFKRFINVKECFKVISPDSIKGKNFIIVDDVSTSGATLVSASLELKKCGAKKIIGLVVAKAA